MQPFRKSAMVIAVLCASLTGCHSIGPGERVVLDKSCGTCHTIPGVNGAHGLVGPPLVSFGKRMYIAGQLPNTRENLVRWVRSPQTVEPDTAMPDLGLSDQQARDVAEFLYTLR